MRPTATIAFCLLVAYVGYFAFTHSALHDTAPHPTGVSKLPASGGAAATAASARASPRVALGGAATASRPLRGGPGAGQGRTIGGAGQVGGGDPKPVAGEKRDIHQPHAQNAVALQRRTPPPTSAPTPAPVRAAGAATESVGGGAALARAEAVAERANAGAGSMAGAGAGSVAVEGSRGEGTAPGFLIPEAAIQACKDAEAEAAKAGKAHPFHRHGARGHGGGRGRDAAGGKGGGGQKVDANFYTHYLHDTLEKKPAYPIIKGFMHKVLEHYRDAHGWFDGGAGTCGTMEAALKAGVDIVGVELSDVSQTTCRPLYDRGLVKQGPLHRIPHPDNAFDLVFSSEVLEHVPTHLAAQSVGELVRIAKRRVFTTISLRPSALDKPGKPPKVHLTVKPRAWWEGLFVSKGCVRDEEAFKFFQQYDAKGQEISPRFFPFICDKS